MNKWYKVRVMWHMSAVPQPVDEAGSEWQVYCLYEGS